MARCLIIGCGCRGRLLAGRLSAAGHAVRGTTRSTASRIAIEAAGAEPVVADPDRVATLAEAFDHVSVTCVLLGSAVGARDRLAALHGPRLEMLLARMLDTTVRGIVYEAVGSVDEAVLGAGAEVVGDACERSLIPYSLLTASPDYPPAWLAAAMLAVEQVLAAR